MPHSPDEYEFQRTLMSTTPRTLSICLEFKHRQTGERAAQGILVSTPVTMEQAGAALKALGEFFQHPDDRLCTGLNPLSGHELRPVQ